MSDGGNGLRDMTFRVLLVFAGVGGGALGFQRAAADFRRLGIRARFEIMGGIELDESTARDFTRLTGAPCLVADVEHITPKLLRDLFGDDPPDVVFFSPPCKQACGLLAKAIAFSAKYVAMGALGVVWVRVMFVAWPRGPRLLLMENVPRIRTRAPAVMEGVRRILREHRYFLHEETHNLGELGGLAQNRERLLLVGRRRDVPALLYQPQRRRVRTVGEVLGALPLPGDPRAGRLHRLPAIDPITALRLALIPAGKDWKALPEKVFLPPELAAVVTRGRRGPSPKRKPFNDVFRVIRMDAPAPCVTAGGTPSAGGMAVADPRVSGISQFTNNFCVQRWDAASRTIAGSTQPGSGGLSVADPRGARAGAETRNDDHGVVAWDQPSGTITGHTRPSNGRFSVADPRPVKECHPHTYGVIRWDGSAHTITGNTVPGGGPFSVADVRLTCTPRDNAGSYGVIPYDAPAGTIVAHACHDNGRFSVAAPSFPADVPFPLIISEDGTWHRPLTTLECAVLQGFDAFDDEGRPFDLDGGTDACRVKIGDAVPPPSAEAIARQMLFTLVDATVGAFSLSTGGDVWVRERGAQIAGHA